MMEFWVKIHHEKKIVGPQGKIFTLEIYLWLHTMQLTKYSINTKSVDWFNLEYLCNRWSDSQRAHAVGKLVGAG